MILRIKDLAIRNISNKFLKDKVYWIASNPKFDGYQRALKNMTFKVFAKETGSGVSLNELHNPVIKNSEKK